MLKFKRINIVSGSTDFPVGNTDALRRTRSECVVKACAEALTSVKETVEPDPELAVRYEDRYNRFRQIYPELKDLFQQLKV